MIIFLSSNKKPPASQPNFVGMGADFTAELEASWVFLISVAGNIKQFLIHCINSKIQPLLFGAIAESVPCNFITLAQFKTQLTYSCSMIKFNIGSGKIHSCYLHVHARNIAAIWCRSTVKNYCS